MKVQPPQGETISLQPIKKTDRPTEQNNRLARRIGYLSCFHVFDLIPYFWSIFRNKHFFCQFKLWTFFFNKSSKFTGLNDLTETSQTWLCKERVHFFSRLLKALRKLKVNGVFRGRAGLSVCSVGHHFTAELPGCTYRKPENWKDLENLGLGFRSWLGEGLPACTAATSWCCGRVTRSSPLPKQSGPSSHGQGFPDLTRQAGQEKYHHTILFMLDLIPNILTIPSVVKKSWAPVCID